MLSGTASRTVDTPEHALAACLEIRGAGGRILSIIGPHGEDCTPEDLQVMTTPQAPLAVARAGKRAQ